MRTDNNIYIFTSIGLTILVVLHLYYNIIRNFCSKARRIDFIAGFGGAEFRCENSAVDDWKLNGEQTMRRRAGSPAQQFLCDGSDVISGRPSRRKRALLPSSASPISRGDV